MSNVNKINELIAENNRIWRQASDKEKRILLAKDCLRQIKTGKYIPKSGRWVGEGTVLRIANSCNPGASIQPVLLDPNMTCECCALGALVLSQVRYSNNVCNKSLGLSLHPSSLEIYGDNAEMIEYCFEKGRGLYTQFCFGREDLKRCLAFIKKYPNKNKRIVAIFENIIKNDGEFKP